MTLVEAVICGAHGAHLPFILAIWCMLHVQVEQISMGGIIWFYLRSIEVFVTISYFKFLEIKNANKMYLSRAMWANSEDSECQVPRSNQDFRDLWPWSSP
jgi:hypothetical protein